MIARLFILVAISALFTSTVASQTLALDSADRFALAKEVQNLIESNSYSEAALKATQHLWKDPNSPPLLYWRSIANSRLAKNDEAFEDISKAIALDSNFREAYIVRGAIYFQKKEYPSAESDLSRVIEMDPKNATAFYMRGQVRALYMEKRDQGCADLKTAVDLGNTSAEEVFANTCGAKPKGDEIVLQFPSDEHWGLESNQENLEIRSLDFVRKGETLDSWKELVNVTQAKGVSKDKKTNLREAMNTIGTTASQNAPEAVVTLREEATTGEHAMILFTVEVPRFKDDPKPESDLYCVIQGKDDLWIAMYATKSAKMPDATRKKWSGILKKATFKKRG